MPLLDHFRPPLYPRHRWESFHSNWATRVADAVIARLPAEFSAEEHVHVGSNIEVDIAAYESGENLCDADPGGVATVTWSPPAPAVTVPAELPDDIEVRVFSLAEGQTLVGAIEFISPGNKNHPRRRQAFARKCRAYLERGVCLVIIDIVTTRRANLHNLLARNVDAAAEYPAGVHLYASTWRPVLRDGMPQVDVWREELALGSPLPTMPLRLTGDLFVPVEFEVAYMEACRRRRLSA